MIDHERLALTVPLRLPTLESTGACAPEHAGSVAMVQENVDSQALVVCMMQGGSLRVEPGGHPVSAAGPASGP